MDNKDDILVLPDNDNIRISQRKYKSQKSIDNKNKFIKKIISGLTADILPGLKSSDSDQGRYQDDFVTRAFPAQFRK